MKLKPGTLAYDVMVGFFWGATIALAFMLGLNLSVWTH